MQNGKQRNKKSHQINNSTGVVQIFEESKNDLLTKICTILVIQAIKFNQKNIIFFLEVYAYSNQLRLQRNCLQLLL